MSNSVIPIDRYDNKESGRTIQEAQNTVMATGAAATVALIRELLQHLKLPEKSVKVEIAINDSVAYRANVRADKKLAVNSENPALSDDQLRYLKEVVKLPESNQPAVTSIPLARDVTITVDGKEVFRLTDGIVEKNLLTPTVKKTQEQPTQTLPTSTQEPEIEENPAQEALVEIVQEDVPELKQAGVSLSDEQRQELEKLGVNSQLVENTVQQKAQGTVPIIVVLNREVERNVSQSTLKENLKSMLSRFQKTVKDFSRKISSFLGTAREKLFPATERGIKQDLQNLAAVNVASKLLERFGSQPTNGKQVFEGNTFRLERQNNNLTVTAKDGRGKILSLQDGELTGFLTQKDLAQFQAVARQLNQDKSRQSQAEIG
jgi:predicted double-glycine peptidase